MEKKFSKGGKKAAAFFKKNVYYILMAVCVIAVVTMVTVAAVSKNKGDDIDAVTPPTIGGEENNKPEEPTITPPPVVDEPFVLGLPVAGSAAVGKFTDGTNNEVSENRDGSWCIHPAEDYEAEVGASVLAVYKGVVKEIAAEPQMGMTITIEHKDGFVSVYKLLADEVNVKAGQEVSKGDVIGKVAEVTGSQEGIKPTHLHFELLKNGVAVNPSAYMAGGDK